MNSSVSVTETIKDLEPVLNQWVEILKKCSVSFPQTRDRWYVECTVTSLLSSAAWLAGSPSIVEVKTKKEASSNPWMGHADLMVDAPRGRVVIEAKIAWLRHLNDIDRLGTALSEARSEVSHVPAEAGVRRLGVAFGIFESQRSPSPNVCGDVIAGLHTRPDLVAWVEPSFAPGAVYAGCILAGVLIGSLPVA